MPKLVHYDKLKLQQAIGDICNGRESYRTAEKKYGIPKSTLEFKIKHPGHKDTLGPSPILTADEEGALVLWIQETASKGFPRKANDLKTSVQKMLTANPRPHKFKNNKPGDSWLKGFLKRHPEISKRTSEGVNSASACVSEQDIRKWFTEITDYIKVKNLEDVIKDPSRIFNGDESGFQVCPSTGKVFAQKGSKNVYSVEKSNSKENITVMFTFSANGEMSVPMVIYPYQRIPEKIVKSINPKWGVGRSENGWMTSETFYQYIANVFYPHLVETNMKFPVILFLDGHKSHLNYQLSLLCSELQIEIISLYPNATRILQPCDVAVFRPLKEAWRQCVRQWEEEHPDEILNKVMFAPLLEKAVNIGVKPSTLFNGFKACGLYPFNPNAIDYSKCLGARKTPDKLEANPVEHLQYMDYRVFAEIIGEDTLTILKNMDINGNTTRNNDQHLKQLFNLWKYFKHSNSQPVNGNSPQQQDKEEKREKEEKGTKNKIQIIQNIVIRSPNANIRVSSASTADETTQSLYFTPNDNKIIINDNLLGPFLASPSAPVRKGKRNVERFPFAITSARYQEMFRKKQALKEEQENEKEARKRRKLENIGNETKRKTLKKLLKECFICKQNIKTDEIRCETCKNYFHEDCIPKTHQDHIPSDDDLFICHNCYKVDNSDFSENFDTDGYESDELSQLYNEAQKKNY